MTLLIFWIGSLLSLAITLTVFTIKLIARLVRWLWRRGRTNHPPPTYTAASSYVEAYQPPLRPSPVGEVEELERCVHWLLWALSQNVTAEEISMTARVTDPSWWATLARVRATIGHLSAISPDVDLAVWCMTIADLDHQRTGTRP